MEAPLLVTDDGYEGRLTRLVRYRLTLMSISCQSASPAEPTGHGQLTVCNGGLLTAAVNIPGGLSWPLGTDTTISAQH